ncbi:hypothetical protein C8F04DRAFT_1183263 [Mycena alexandri]|uniref:Uncharacterized protein n=1 Tax=Mycena alexandri TaxID=1745969 RepID=A0AAD6SUT7_9AGAR|nr:hypothetical protein C8F04DRAFT_1183263 [Mycena alexandri]
MLTTLFVLALCTLPAAPNSVAAPVDGYYNTMLGPHTLVKIVNIGVRGSAFIFPADIDSVELLIQQGNTDQDHSGRDSVKTYQIMSPNANEVASPCTTEPVPFLAVYVESW